MREGDDYRLFKKESKKVIDSCASTAVSIKTVLDTPLLTDEGLLTEGSGIVAAETEKKLIGMQS